MAAGTKRTVLIEILGDSKGYRAASKGAADSTEQLGRAIVKTYIAKQVVDFGRAAVTAASNMAESQSKIGVIFEQSGDKVIAWSKTTAKSMGLSQQAALDAASTYAVFGKSAGLAGDELVGFSTDLTGLSSDLASFHNTSPEEAILAIGAALRGESEPIRRYGVLLNDAALKQRALEMKIYDGVGALTAQQRVLAAQAEILAQTGDAQGDFARTADGMANQARILAAQWADMQAQLGQALMPVMMQMIDVLSATFGWYNSLNSEQQTLIATTMLVAGALYIGVAAFNAVSVSVARMGLTMASATPWLIGIGAALTITTIALGFLGDESVETKKRADDFYKAVAAGISTIDAQRLAFISATEAAAEYADVAYGEAEKQLREKLLGNKQHVAAMKLLGLEIDEVVASTRGGVAAEEAMAKAQANRTQITKVQAQAMWNRAEISQQEFFTISSQIDAENELIAVMRNQTQAQIDSTQAAIDRLAVGDVEAAQWLKATGQLDQLSRAGIMQAEWLLDSASAAGDSADAQSDLATATDDANKEIEEQLAALEELWNATRSAIDSEYGLRDAMRGTRDAIDEYNEAVDGGKSSTRELTELQEAAEQAALKQADAAVRLAEDQAKASGATLTAEDKNRIFIASLADAAGAMGPDSPMRKTLNELIAEFNAFPSSKNSTITVDIITGSGSHYMKKYADGGKIPAGQFGLVGETYQDEIVSRPTIVRGPAQVTGVRETAAAMAGGPAGAFMPTFIVASQTSAQELAREAIWQWRLN